MSAITLHGTPTSGHSHRVELLLLMLDLPYRFETTPPAARRSPAFSALNPLQQIPVLCDGDLVLQDSNAILVYLAKRYDPGGAWLPDEPILAARVQRWLSIAAGEIAYGPARARAILQWSVPGELADATETAQRILHFMNGHLAERTYLATDQRPTIADLACYSYVAHAPEGGISLDAYPAVRRWLSQLEALPRFTPMPRSPIPSPPSAV
jgi:glutathione S-transferase